MQSDAEAWDNHYNRDMLMKYASAVTIDYHKYGSEYRQHVS